jgi:pyruvate-ferredoxin/flavodoxin oxidoreductase
MNVDSPISPHSKHRISMDGAEAAATVAYRMSDLIAIYPITPSTPLGEWADEWAARGKPNIWHAVPRIVEMQSEAGVAGAVHGMLQGGALATTFTASQGLLLMLPVMYKIAGQMMPFCMHVAARTVATHALSIFGDHSDVMGARATGFAMLASADPQEAHDMAAVAHGATLEARVPFMHFFDGFRTSHEINDVCVLGNDVLETMVCPHLLLENQRRALSPDRPTIRGTAQNPDVFFQTREASNPVYGRVADIVQAKMDRLASLVGREYRVFDYFGAKDAERVIVVMGSGAQTCAAVAEELVDEGEKVGVLQVRLFRPFDAARFVAALPATVRRIAVLDRTKEPGATGEPLYLDTVAALARVGAGKWERLPVVVGGRYGLGSKEFTPSMAAGVFARMDALAPDQDFTVGIVDDLTGKSLEPDTEFRLPLHGLKQAVFYGLGSDGTVGANKNTIKIIAKCSGEHAQAYFVYDSKKAGAVTVSHLRFGPEPIHAPYLVERADFVGCHQFDLLEQQPVLESAAEGAVFLLNSPYGPGEVWKHLSRDVQEMIINKKLKFHVIDAYRVARETGMGARINTIMQTCYFALADVLPVDQAIAEIKEAIHSTYSRKGAELVAKNNAAVDRAIENLREVVVPDVVDGPEPAPVVSMEAPEFVRAVTASILSGRGDALPSSALPAEGIWPTGTSRWEKRNLATEIPVWDASICIQCNKCVLVCPHAAIRAKHYPQEALNGAPETFKSVAFRSPEIKDHLYTIQVAPEDCTGCRLCIEVCPAKDKSNPKHKALDPAPQRPLRAPERENYAFFLDLPNPDRTRLKADIVKDSQFFEPLFEYSGACVGCGETPYIKLLTQLYGDRALIANATGCSSIYGGNLPTTPYTKNAAGRGPAWANSLFEDNAEFGLGLRMSADLRRRQAEDLLRHIGGWVGGELVDALLNEPQDTETSIAAQRVRVEALRGRLGAVPEPLRSQVDALADALVTKSVWIVGGDGWAYDIGFGGLDHVLSLGEKINILVLDTEVYSNTGGQQSKSTPLGAVAKFAANGKAQGKKDLALYAMNYGNVYVARVAFGAKDSQTVKAFAEAEAYPGTSLIIAYSHCIAHGFNLTQGLDHQKSAVATGYWPLLRFDPRRREAGENALVMDSPAPKQPLSNFTDNEIRYRSLNATSPDRARVLAERAQADVDARYVKYSRMAANDHLKSTDAPL